MTEQEAIHTRLDYMEEKFDSKMGELADSIKETNKAVIKLIESVAENKAMETRISQHSHEIKYLAEAQSENYKRVDERLDEIDQKIPIYDLGIKIIFTMVILLLSSVATAVYSLVINT